MNEKFTKNDLKAGYVVKDRDGCLYMIMPAKDDQDLYAVDNNEYFLDLKCLDSALINQLGGHRYDIMEVYGYNSFASESLRISTKGRKLLWKREPEKTCDNCIHKPVCNHVGTCEHFMNKV